MRLVALLCALVAAALSGFAAPAGAAGVTKGFVVYKDMRNRAVTEIRDAYTGRLVSSEELTVGKAGSGTECGDSHPKFIGARWKEFEPYLVNAQSAPAYLPDKAEALADLRASHVAWQSPFVTNCSNVDRTSPYQAVYGGTTTSIGSLLGLKTDGMNVVAFASLAGTICDGALACTITDFNGSTIGEADMVFEVDLTRYGFQDFWTTGDTTLVGPTSGEFAIVDTATHEFGHWAGLGHVDKSPQLTMYPFIHDGMQSLGLGDMLGMAARYH